MFQIDPALAIAGLKKEDTMNVGDKVRYMSGKEEGVVVKILPGNQVEVEIEDGFVIPFSRNDLVLVSKEEEDTFSSSGTAVPKSYGRTVVKTGKKAKKPVGNTEQPKPSMAQQGIFLAFEPQNAQDMDLQFINNTDFDLLFTFGREYEGIHEGLASGVAGPKSFTTIHRLTKQNFESWGSLQFEVLFFRHGRSPKKAPIAKNLKFSAKTFLSHKAVAPITGKESLVFQLDKQEMKIEANEIREKMLEGMKTEPLKDMGANAIGNISHPPKGKALEVDLHWEALGKDGQQVSTEHKLEVQLAVFEQKLDEAIVSGYSEVIFIHGVGNGTLRHQIQKRLSKHIHVAYFEDAQKEKFGYGATAAKIK